MTKTNAKAKTKTQDKYISRTPSNSDPKDLFVSFDTFYQSDEGTWPDQQKGNDKDKDKGTDKDKDIFRPPSTKSDPRDLWPWRQMIKAILVTCDIWDTDYNYGNWESVFMIIFVTLQWRVTLDNIRNSCDVLWDTFHKHLKLPLVGSYWVLHSLRPQDIPRLGRKLHSSFWQCTIHDLHHQYLPTMTLQQEPWLSPWATLKTPLIRREIIIQWLYITILLVLKYLFAEWAKIWRSWKWGKF